MKPTSYLLDKVMIFNYIFGISMWLGLGVALYIALMPVFGMIWHPTLLLGLSLGHLVFLSVIAWLKVWGKKADNVDIGSRLATTGYLHTLIGTCAALVAAADFSGDVNEIQQIIKPIGAALGTSIIGWWMGKEIQRSVWGSVSERSEFGEEVDNAFGELARSVRNLSHKLSNSGDEWKKSVDSLSKKLDDAGDDMVKKWQASVDNLQKALNGASDDLKKTIEAASAGLKTATSSVSSLSTSVKSILDTTNKQVKKLSSSLESSIKAIAEESAKTSSSMATISSGAKITAEKITEINESLESAKKIIDEADKLLAQLRRE